MNSKAKAVKLNVEIIPKGYRYILQAPSVSFFTKLLLGLLTLTCLFYVLSTLVRSEVSEGAIIGAIVVTLILLFIARLFLWNAFGREIFEVSSETIRHYNDYKFFQDELLKVNASDHVKFSYQSILDSPLEINILDEQERNLSNEYYLVIQQDGKELSKSHLSLRTDQIKRIFRKET